MAEEQATPVQTQAEGKSAGADKDKQTLNLVITEFERYAQMRKPFENRWREEDRYYHMIADPAMTQPGRANLVLVDAFEATETVVPRIVGNRARFRLAATRDDTKQAAEIQTELCDYQQDRMDSELITQDMYRDVAKHGTGITFQGWKQAIRKFTFEDTVEQPSEVEPGKIEGEFKRETVTEEVICDDPEERWLSLWQVYLDPYIQNMDDQYSVIIVRAERRSWAKAMIDQKIFRAKVEDLKAGGMAKDSPNNPGPKEQSAAQGLQFDFLDDSNDPYGIIFERWTGDRVITTWNNQVILRDRPTPFKHGKIPLLHAVYTRVAGSFYGKGVIGAAISLLLEGTAHRNNILDDANSRAHSMWLRKRGSKVDEDQLQDRPNGIVDVTNMGDVQRLDRGPADPLAISIMEVVKTDIRRATGQGGYALGELPSKRVTNGEVAAGEEGSSTRMDMPLATFEIMYVKRKGLMLYKMNQQFVGNEKTYRVTGKIGFTKTISCNQIQGDFDVIPVSGASRGVNRAVRRDAKLRFFSIVKGAPWFNEAKFAADLLTQDYDYVDAEEYILAQALPKQGADEARMQALAENMTFLRTGFIGQALAHEDHPMHVLVHEQVYRAPVFRKMPPQVQQAFLAHILRHDDFEKRQAPAGPSPTGPLLPGGEAPGAEAGAIPPEAGQGAPGAEPPNPQGI